MKKLMLILMCAATITSVAACGVKEPVTPEVTKAVTETKQQKNKKRLVKLWVCQIHGQTIKAYRTQKTIPDFPLQFQKTSMVIHEP